MTNDKPDLRRFRLVLALEKLTPPLRADVLADGTIAARLDVPAKPSAQLFETVTVLRDSLFMAFRNAADGLAPSPLMDADGRPVDAKVCIDPKGSGIVEIGQKRLRFAQAALLSSDPAKRLAYLETALHQYPLTRRDADHLSALVAKAKFGDGDFLSAGRSVTLSDYIDNELQAERTAQLELNRSRAFYPMSVTFPAPSLVPFSLLQKYDAESVADMIQAVANVDDHFALVGAFEICADWVQRDSRFVSLGDRVLDRLFADMERLAAACGMFAAVFVVATAHLAEHETLRRQPVYWRRLAAASHASLVVRICGTSGIKPDEIVAWAMRISGKTYFLSVVSDLAVEPQWNPEWIVPTFLLADVAGRALGTWHRLPGDVAPESWKSKLDVVQTWIKDKKLGPLLTYPAVLEGTRRPRQPTITEFESGNFTAAVSAYRDLADDPSVEKLLVVSPLVEAFGFPNEARADVMKVLDLIRSQGGDGDEPGNVVALSVLAHISILTNDVALADEVAEACMERALIDPNRVFEIVVRLVECSGVIADRDSAMTTLARRLEVLALALPSSEVISGLISAIESLRRVQPLLAPLLGKALAAARLALPRSTVA